MIQTCLPDPLVAIQSSKPKDDDDASDDDDGEAPDNIEHLIGIVEEQFGPGFAKFYKGCPHPQQVKQDPRHPLPDQIMNWRDNLYPTVMNLIIQSFSKKMRNWT